MEMHSEKDLIYNSHKNINSTVAETIKRAGEFLEGSKLENPEIDCEILMRSVLGIDRAKLYSGLERNLSLQELEKYDGLVRRRSMREPLQYILGVQEFWSLEFVVNRNVLVPRPETEVLVEKVIALANNKNINNEPLKILDIGTGSGNIAVSLARELRNAEITATDISLGALEVAKINSKKNGVKERIEFIHGDLFEPFHIKDCSGETKNVTFDFIVSNPPYIPSGDLDGLSPEVSEWEPRIGLDGGEDGLNFYRRILKEAFHYLKDDGFVLFEIGESQGEEIKKIAGLYKKYRGIKIYRDYSAKDRVAQIWTK